MDRILVAIKHVEHQQIPIFISLIDLESKPCDFGMLVFHSIIGQYCVPKTGAERKKPKNTINIDLVSIFNDPIYKVNYKK